MYLDGGDCVQKGCLHMHVLYMSSCGYILCVSGGFVWDYFSVFLLWFICVVYVFGVTTA